MDKRRKRRHPDFPKKRQFWRPCKVCRSWFWSPRQGVEDDWSVTAINMRRRVRAGEWQSPPHGSKTCSRECAEVQQGRITRRQQLRRGPNKIEKILRRLVHEEHPEARISYEWRVGRYSIDVFVHDLDLAYEADGSYWHSLPGIAEKDARRDRDLLERGIRTIRYGEQELREIGKRQKAARKGTAR